MNKYLSHSLAFVFGATVAFGISYVALGNVGSLFLIETQSTHQKINLTTLNLIREGKIENSIRMLEALTCTYFDIESEKSVTEIQKATNEYFSKYYPQGNSPCTYYSGNHTK